MSLTQELEKVREEIECYAKEYQLDYFHVNFEIVDYDKMNEIASYGGFPTRYPHWRYGMEYDYLVKGYRYGLQKIYELVINNDPCYAYLLKSNSFLDQKLVMAHVYGHSDFFKNNDWFAHTDRKMVDRMANHASRVRRYADKYGFENVENFIDFVLSIEDHIDINAPQRRGVSFEAREYGEKDLLLFLLERAPLEPWQQDILWIVREESFYFAPQRQTKIMNEGWASFWHSKMLTEKVLTDAEVVDYADNHSATLVQPPNSINPYKIGIELFKDIERQISPGLKKIFEVRKTHNDITFLDTFLTPEFCEKHELFVYNYNPRTGNYEITSRKFEDIKEKLLFGLTNLGRPFIYVTDENYEGNHELYLTHDHQGVDLDLREAFSVLESLRNMWQKPIHLSTTVNGQKKLLSFDGFEQKERNI
ncbi:MAG: SpoVR family protein [Deltaproteobacteria bacterium]|nr:SpoVR family protein [Deltaproteobacteria bacterium]